MEKGCDKNYSPFIALESKTIINFEQFYRLGEV